MNPRFFSRMIAFLHDLSYIIMRLVVLDLMIQKIELFFNHQIYHGTLSHASCLQRSQAIAAQFFSFSMQ